MPLSWNEIQNRTAFFVLEWKDKVLFAREEADTQTFLTEFFNIFGVSRKRVVIFEKFGKFGKKVHIHNGTEPSSLFGESEYSKGYIDLLWEGHILIKMKSPGKDLEKAYRQAQKYANALAEKKLPKGILICDFNTFHYYDLEEHAKVYRFSLAELPRHLRLFSYLAGYSTVGFKTANPADIEAAEKMSLLHNCFAESGYTGHDLEVCLVRLLFCLFADDTGIFEPKQLFTYLKQRTHSDGSDLALHIGKIFDVLNTQQDKRLTTLDEQLNRFPYIDGGLFAERIKTADCTAAMRNTLLDCCALDWSAISPAIFGAMFQSVMNDKERHDIGAHYTSEQNIMKVIKPLFLDGLRAEFEKIRAYRSEIRTERLIEFHSKLARLRFLDPACGCGNFLVISYRELRRLEMDVIAELVGEERLLDVDQYITVNVDQFYGIELEEFPAQIAQTALWLTDHHMNMQVRKRFGQYYVRIPLFASASIRCANALTTDWESIVPKNELSYIVGNPPFLGAHIMNSSQKAEVRGIFDTTKSAGELDYVTCWYKKAACYIQNTNIECAFVSTNSICQGLQVPILWPELMNRYMIKINFAHQTFKWLNEARGKAAVYCVIIGFSVIEREHKKLFLYETVTGKPTENTVHQINAYLIDAPMIFIERRSDPICKTPKMLLGNTPRDDGNFFFDEHERNAIVKTSPELAEIIRPFLGAYEFLNNIPRYCLWLKDVPPDKYRNSKEIMERIAKVKMFRGKSVRGTTGGQTGFPTLFSEIRQPDTDYILVPLTTSEHRKYIPIGFVDKNVICGNSNSFIPNAGLYEFGILTSVMHMAWMRYVCGRLELRYRYSGVIVYNNFPWPFPTEEQQETKEALAAIKAVEDAAQAVLDVRALFPDSSLAILYNPSTMPPELTKAHQTLDEAVDRAYGRTFDNDAQRVSYLFELYQKLSNELFIDIKKRGKGRKM
ncbi:hypothetical protein PilKf_00329 [Pillotina sp. SPG140]|jgi:hypothetical protein